MDYVCAGWFSKLSFAASAYKCGSVQLCQDHQAANQQHQHQQHH
jgi:hypothetical protein